MLPRRLSAENRLEGEQKIVRDPSGVGVSCDAVSAKDVRNYESE